MREALIVWGGWSGHEPEACAAVIRDMLTEDGFKVRVENTTAAFADPAIHDLSLIVPIVTMSKIEKEEARTSPPPSKAVSALPAITAAPATVFANASSISSSSADNGSPTPAISSTTPSISPGPTTR